MVDEAERRREHARKVRREFFTESGAPVFFGPSTPWPGPPPETEIADRHFVTKAWRDPLFWPDDKLAPSGSRSGEPVAFFARAVEALAAHAPIELGQVEARRCWAARLIFLKHSQGDVGLWRHDGSRWSVVPGASGGFLQMHGGAVVICKGAGESQSEDDEPLFHYVENAGLSRLIESIAPPLREATGDEPQAVKEWERRPDEQMKQWLLRPCVFDEARRQGGLSKAGHARALEKMCGGKWSADSIAAKRREMKL